MNKTKSKLMIALIVFVVLICIALPLFQFSLNWLTRFVSGQHLFGGSPAHSSLHENLPSIAIESGRVVCCRMKLCDFRFPLPDGAKFVTNDPISGGPDTIKGAIYVTNSQGSAVDLKAYRKKIWRWGFDVSASPDFMFTASSPDGGALQVETVGQTTEIAFSFFGDY